MGKQKRNEVQCLRENLEETRENSLLAAIVSEIKDALFENKNF
jgi:hypothetical protein